ncbi:MAG TPA: NADH-quinone oxidoreductase subunit NuoF [Thermodesulfobacteriota bacterium]|nr:NADH-quinone oxidoreductase subunit NuoF [Thermodesulfobacteriota bacterium]
MEKLTSAAQLESLRKEIIQKRKSHQPCITICAGTGCLACGCEKVVDGFKKEIEKQKLQDRVTLRLTGCPGFCERGPLVVIYPKGIFYQQVTPEDITEILEKTIAKDELVERLLYQDPKNKEKILIEDDVPFYKKQMRLLLGNNSKIDPCNIDDYLAVGGYTALGKALFRMKPEEIVAEVKKSGLRGRGGGGFPTGVKWESCRKAEGNPKYLICNSDEGDPGAFMDRSLLEGNPHSVIEGMIIGAFAIGSHDGYIYVRNEYPLAVKNAATAIEQAEQYGFLGKNILGSGLDFEIKINRGGGSFVCGESSALFASIEGRIGEPRDKYIHATDKGLWDKPTTLNNVETWANVPLIINKGADWYSKIGTEGSKGTKIFSLVGKINNTGLVEVPMGITFREIIYEIGGGILKDRKFKAVQTGGPSGGCLSEKFLDLPIDFDALTEAGSMMGSGGMIVMDDRTCMVDVARYFLAFLEEESCGKCTPCREGLKKMKAILEAVCGGRGKQGDIELLERLSRVLIDGAICGLGNTAPNPVLTTIRYFRDEYEAHINQKKCPGGVCKALIKYSIDPEKCTGCGACLKVCAAEAVTGERKQPHVIDLKKCIKCGACYEACKFDAVVVS